MTSPTQTISRPPATQSSPASLGEMLLDAADRYSGVALEYRRDGRQISITYPELGAQAIEIASGLIALGIEPAIGVAILAATSASMDAGRLRRAVRRRRRGADLPHELGRGVRLCARPLRCEARVLRGRRPGGQDRAGPRRLPGGRARDHPRGPGGAMRSRSIELVDRGARRRPSGSTNGSRRGRAEDLATLVYTSGTTGPPKGCMLTHGEPDRDATRMYIDELELDERHVALPVPAARARARAGRAGDRHQGRRPDRCFWGGDTTRIVDELSELRPTHFPAVPRIYEKIHGAVDPARSQDGPALQRLRCSSGRSRRASGPARGAAPGRAPGPIQDDCSTGSRIGWCSAKVRRLFGDGLQLALVGAAPSRASCSSSSTPAACCVLEGYGLTETLRRGDAQHAATRCGSARVGQAAARHRGRRSPPTARS